MNYKNIKVEKRENYAIIEIANNKNNSLDQKTLNEIGDATKNLNKSKEIKCIGLIGGILLLYICYKLYRDVIQNKIEEKNIEVDNSNLKKAIFTVILADVTMSLDNVLGVAGAAGNHYTLLAFGLGLSILLMAFAANYTAKLIKRYSWISWVGLIAILFVAFQLIYEDLRILL